MCVILALRIQRARESCVCHVLSGSSFGFDHVDIKLLGYFAFPLREIPSDTIVVGHDIRKQLCQDGRVYLRVRCETSPKDSSFLLVHTRYDVVDQSRTHLNRQPVHAVQK